MKKNLVFIHGSAASKRNFRTLIRNLPEYNCLAFDLIGFGAEKKPKIEYNLEVYLNFIQNKLDLQKKYVLIGHSMGGILSKEFALRHPRTAEKVLIINYPFNQEKIKHNWLNQMFIKETWTARAMCNSKVLWKFLALPIGLIFFTKYLDSFWDYFKHSFHSESGTLKSVILKDDHNNLKKLKNKLILISGGRDPFLITDICSKYKNYLIKDMGHLFFGFEEKIAKIIKRELGS